MLRERYKRVNARLPRKTGNDVDLIGQKLNSVIAPSSWFGLIFTYYLPFILLISTTQITILPANCFQQQQQQQQQQTSNSIAPTIDYSHNMRILKLPRSTPPGSLIYRLKGSDGDPNTQLVFGVSGIEGRSLIDVVPVARSWNEADVYLRNALDDQAVHNLTIYVSDGNKTTQVESTIYVTDDSQVHSSESGTEADLGLSSPFVNAKHVFHVPENTKPDEPIGFVTALESQKSDLPVKFELRGRGADKFAIKYVFGPKGQSKADIVLAQQVDYEKQNLFTLKVLALNAWSNIALDTRNVATMDIVITLSDVQDTPPVFKNLPQSIKLFNTMQTGELIYKLEAEDGDYADQRPVNFALDANSPLSSYFDIEKLTGELRLRKPISELALHAAWDSAAWSVLTVFASELPDTTSYDHLWPLMYTKVELPLVLVDLINEPPQFIGGWQTLDSVSRRSNALKTLHGYLVEPQSSEKHGDSSFAAGTLVRWYTNSSETGSPLADNLTKSMLGRPTVLDLGLGANGTFELTLEGPDAHLFQLDPPLPVTKQTVFSLSLAPDANKSMFDRDNTNFIEQSARSAFSLEIVAKDFGSPQRESSRIKCLIELLDANDNVPQFESDLYTFSVYENAQLGQLVGSVRARDADSKQAGRVRYVALTGQDSQMFKLNSDSGQISLEGHLDREKRNFYLFLVEAADLNGAGHSNYSQVVINVVDVNDNAPVFLQSHYDAVLLADGTFHQPLVVRAIDADEPNSANSQVAYEIIAGNQNDQFSIDTVSGAIYPANLDLSGPEGPISNNKIANVLPQIPSILTEPIKPQPLAEAGSHYGNHLAGKILPSHEVEEAAYPPTSASRFNIRQSHNHSLESESAPRSLESEKSSLGTVLPRVPPMDTEQLPALDLLLNLESEQVQVNSNGRNLGNFRSAFGANIMRQVPPITTLIVRAHDFGIPLRSSTIKVNIYNQALQTRSVSVILNGTAEQLEPRREAIERAFSSLTGSRANIESIDALSESSSISVARVKLAVPQHSLVDLTDLSALMSAIEYQPAVVHYDQRHPSLHYNPALVSNITSADPSSLFGDMHSYALDATKLEGRLLLYIIIVGVCIFAVLAIWAICFCLRPSQVKIIEKTVPIASDRQRRSNDEGSYRQRRLSDSRKTQVKTADASTSSPIGNNLAKQQANQRNDIASALSSAMNELAVPNTNNLTTKPVKADHFSMYNGQVWFEPAASSAPPPSGRFLAPTMGRRASSAPSAASLDSALQQVGGRAHLAGSVTPRDASGQFFPNTIGYMENLAALSGFEQRRQLELEAAYGRLAHHQEAGSKLSRRQRARKVVPMRDSLAGDIIEAAPSKPARLSVHGHANEAFEEDLESGRRHAHLDPADSGEGERHRRAGGQRARRRASAAGSLSAAGTSGSSSRSSSQAESLVLDSDQELLGFDSTGTPIIATHTRTSVRPLIVDVLEPAPVGTLAGQTIGGPRERLERRATPPGGASETGLAAETTAKPPDGASDTKSATGPGEPAPAQLQLGEHAKAAKEFKKASSQGDLMSELNERLTSRRQQTVDVAVKPANWDQSAAQVHTANNEELAVAVATASPDKQRAKLQRLKSASSESSATTTNGNDTAPDRRLLLRDMNNGELLEKQSIFAITYSGLATDKPPSADIN